MIKPPDDSYPTILTAIENSWLFPLIVILAIAIGIGFLICGYLLFIKQKMTVLPRRYRQNVKPKDIGEMTAQTGFACFIYSAGFIIGGVIELATGLLMWGILIVGTLFFIGCLVFDKAVSKYNKP
ncbi:MAG: hypothetical protein IJ639_03025 [Ruminococcus sp.]|nr:hypothetical protein [Ruminococcus sp.]